MNTGRPEVVIDPLAFSLRAIGGVSRVWATLLPRFAASDIPMRLTCGRPLRVALEEAPGADVRRLDGRSIIPANVRRFVPYLGDGLFFPTYFRPVRRGRPNVQLVHDCYKELYYRPPKLEFVRIRRERIYTNATRLVAISETTRLELARLCGDAVYDLTRVIRNPVDYRHIRACAETEGDLFDHLAIRQKVGDRPFAMFIGHRFGVKNFLEVRYLLKALPDHVLVAVGAPASPAEQVLVAESGGRIIFAGPVSDTVMFRLLKESHFLFWPSRIEGFGLPVVESLFLGTPVVALNTPITVEVSMGAAHFFEGSSAESIRHAVAAVRRLPPDDPQVARLIARYDPDTVANAYLSVLRELL